MASDVFWSPARPQASPVHRVGILTGVLAGVLIGVLAGVLPAHAQPIDCASQPINQELDFWIGDWDVHANGQLAGRNRIERALGGCVLIERWTSAAGSSGTSLNWVDRSTAATPRWRQLWVDQGGRTLDYTQGELVDGAMRFQGHTVGEGGARVLQRLTLIPVAADTLRQRFATSTDGGESWEPGWEGLYVRRADAGEAEPGELVEFLTSAFALPGLRGGREAFPDRTRQPQP